MADPSITPETAVARFDEVPINGFLGYRLVERQPGQAEIRMRPRAELLQEEGVVQGGILSALADTAAVYALYPDLDPRQSMTSIEFKVNFLRPALPDRGELVARSKLLHRGRRIALVEAEVQQADKAVLRGTFTCLIFDRPS